MTLSQKTLLYFESRFLTKLAKLAFGRATSDERAANAALICAPAAKDVVERVHQPERTDGRGRGVIINCRGRRGFAARQRIATRNTHTFLVGLFGRYSETEREGCWNRENTSERRRGRGSHAVVEPAARSGRRTAESGIRESRKSAPGQTPRNSSRYLQLSRCSSSSPRPQ